MSGGEQPRAFTYRDAGVDNTSGSRAKERIGEMIRGTYTDQVLGDFGHFGGMFMSPGGGNQVLVSSADSVGTKVLLAVNAGQHDTIGIDLVNHSINDILCCGARPLFFLDYFATSNLDESVLADLVAGMTSACKDAGCALIGGETAQLPGIYQPGTYDLAGFVVGSVDRDQIIDGSRVQPGHKVVGLRSHGLHTNGYSLARAVFGLDSNDQAEIRARLEHHIPELGETLGAALLRPHKSYLLEVNGLFDVERPAALAHITGGGIAGNLERVIPAHCTAVIDPETWSAPPIFDLLQRTGDVDRAEMFRVFNMGVGLIAVMSESAATDYCQEISDAFVIGEVRESTPGDPRVVVQGIDGD